MSLQELKQQLHDFIDASDDEAFLADLLEMLHARSETNPDIFDALSPEERAQLLRSFEQAKNGEVYTHEEMIEKVKQWSEERSKRKS